MNTTKKIEILQHALEYILDVHETATIKYEDTLGIYYNDDAHLEIIQDTETLITEMNYLIIGLKLQETEEQFGGAV